MRIYPLAITNDNLVRAYLEWPIGRQSLTRAPQQEDMGGNKRWSLAVRNRILDSEHRFGLWSSSGAKEHESVFSVREV